MRQAQVEKLVGKIAIPIGGLALAFYLAGLPGERPSLVFLALSMMGIPFVTARDKQRREDEEGDGHR